MSCPTNLFEMNFKLILPEFFLITCLLLLTLFGSFFSVSKKYKFPLVYRPMAHLSILVLSFSCVLITDTCQINDIIFNSSFISDVFSQGGKLIILLSAIIYIMIVVSYLTFSKINSFEYLLLILLSILGQMILCSSFDFLSLYLSIELQSLALYTLAAFNRKSAYSTEAALKYFILGALSSGFLLFGISLIYGFSGTTNFEDLRILLSLNLLDCSISKVSIAFISAAFFFKISAAPFHIWLPDVYEGAPLPSTIYFAIIPKIAVFLVIIRLFFVSFSTQPEFWQFIFCVSAVFSVVIGSLLALKQRKIKRLFAFSAVSHSGYLLFGLSSCEIEGVHSALLYLIFYVITGLGLWSGVVLISYSNKFCKVLTLIEFNAISKSNPFLAFSVLLLVFSLAGIPPLMGFFTKFFIIVAAVQAKLFIPSFIIIVTSVVSTYFYIRVVKTLYFEQKKLRAHSKKSCKNAALSISIFSSALLVCFVSPEAIWLFSYKMALVLFT